MNNVIQFPGEQERDWRIWEEEIRKACRSSIFDETVIEDCLPVIKKHWRSIFEHASLHPKAVTIPGPLSEAQISAINEAGQAAADVFIARLKKERSASFALLMNAELLLSYYRRYGVPPVTQT